MPKLRGDPTPRLRKVDLAAVLVHVAAENNNCSVVIFDVEQIWYRVYEGATKKSKGVSKCVMPAVSLSYTVIQSL